MDNTSQQLKDQFESEYDVFNFKDYYSEWIGAACVGIHTNETEDEIRAKYQEIISDYEPFVIVNDQVYELVYRNAEREFERDKKKRQRHTDDYGYQEGEFEKYHQIDDANDLETQIISKMAVDRIISAINSLPRKQSSRLYKYLIEEMTIEEIAAEEQVSAPSVWGSITSAKKKLQIKLKNFQKTP